MRDYLKPEWSNTARNTTTTDGTANIESSGGFCHYPVIYSLAGVEGLFVVVAVILLVLYCRRKHKRQRAGDAESGDKVAGNDGITDRLLGELQKIWQTSLTDSLKCIV